ncbi:MAG: COX15/CtaA family protein [Bdellovibrionales bacterium]|nr:COX15/CtaA family protein [Bdellovibrionales bacterium]
MNAYKKLSLSTLLLTMLLVMLGGVVHNTGSSLACPDWPLCFGQVFPKMEGPVAIEHSHRLLASLVGLLVIGLVFMATRIKNRPDLVKGSLLALALVIFQGVLGGTTVLMQLSPYVSTAHLATSQIFLGTLLWLNFRARLPILPANVTVPDRQLGTLRVGAALLFLQMLLGAAIRHGGAGVACGLGSESMFLCQDPLTAHATLWPSFGQGQLHMLHRFGAIMAAVGVIGCSIPMLKWAKANGHASVRKLCVLGHILWTFQMVVGILTIRNYIGVVTTTLHLTLAMLLWITMLSIYFTAASPRWSRQA